MPRLRSIDPLHRESPIRNTAETPSTGLRRTTIHRGQSARTSSHRIRPPMRRLAFLAITLSAAAAYSQAPAIPTPPKEHPRLYVRASDLPQIREHIRHPRLEPVRTKLLKTSRTSPDGLGRDDTTKLIAAQALVHLI